MVKRILTVTTLLLAIIITTCPAQSAEQKILKSINFTTQKAGIDQITFALNGPHIPKIFAIKGERPRVVFDFLDTKPARLLKNTINTNGKFVQRIRMGIHVQPVAKTRIVFDLVLDKKIDFKQHFDKQKNMLTLTVFKAGTPPEQPVILESDNKKRPQNARSESKKATKNIAKKPEKDIQPPQTQEGKPHHLQKTKTQTTATIKKSAADNGVGVKANLTEKKADTLKKPSTKKPVPVVKNTKSLHKEKAQITPRKPTQKIAPKPKEKKKDAAKPVNKTKTAVVQKMQKKSSPVLKSVRFDNKSNQGEVVFFRLNAFKAPVVFGVEDGKPQVVCDFLDTKGSKELPAKISVKGKYIQAIRIQKMNTPQKVRVILDLAAKKNYDLQQVFFKKENLFVLIINTQGNVSVKQAVKIPSE